MDRCARPNANELPATATGTGKKEVKEVNKNPLNTNSSRIGANTDVTLKRPMNVGASGLMIFATSSTVLGPCSCANSSLSSQVTGRQGNRIQLHLIMQIGRCHAVLWNWFLSFYHSKSQKNTRKKKGKLATCTWHKTMVSIYASSCKFSPSSLKEEGRITCVVSQKKYIWMIHTLELPSRDADEVSITKFSFLGTCYCHND